MKKLCVSVAIVALGVVANADVVVQTWTGNGGDNKWMTVANWDPVRQPTSLTEAHFPSGDWTIDFTGVDNWYDSIHLDAGSGTVTLVGAGRVRTIGTGLMAVAEGRTLVFDGPTVEFKANAVQGDVRLKSGKLSAGADQMFCSGHFIVEGGFFSGGTSTLTFTNNAVFSIYGGEAKTQYWKFLKSDVPGERGGLLRLFGGELGTNSSYPDSNKYTEGQVEFHGGTLLVGATGPGNGSNYFVLNENLHLMPPVGGVIKSLSTITKAQGGIRQDPLDGKTPAAAMDVEAGGVFCTTNCEVDTAGMLNFYGVTTEPTYVRGGPTFFVRNLKLRGGNGNVFHFENCTANLGDCGIRLDQNYTSTAYFDDGVTFGAWADWASDASNTMTKMHLRLNGPVAFETKDCVDGETPRTIVFNRAEFNDMTDLSASGGGRVEIPGYAGDMESLRSITVGAGTTLSVANKAATALKAMNLTLGENATLELDLAKGSFLDVAGVATFGTNARIVITGLPAITSNVFYPIYLAPVGTSPDLAKVEFAEGVSLPEDWVLVKERNCIYCRTNGPIAVATVSNNNYYYWYGNGGDNKYMNKENWRESRQIKDGVAAAFNGRLNTDIALPDEGIAPQRFLFGHSGNFLDAGPHVFSGGTIAFSNGAFPGNASVSCRGKFPEVFSNAVTSAGNPLRFEAFGEGSVVLCGGTGATPVPLGFTGDIRLGADWTATCLMCVETNSLDSKTAIARRPRLTVMPGATLTVTAQDGAVDAIGDGRGALAIAAGGAATIGGTSLAFQKPSNHYVDGTLTVTCPFSTAAKQAFRGTGTVKLLGGVAIEGDAGEVRLEGGVTLVPGGTWDAKVSVHDTATVAPAADWTVPAGFGRSVLNHATLTLDATDGKVTVTNTLTKDGGAVVVKGGTVAVNAAGVKFWKLSCANGGKVSFGPDYGSTQAFSDILAVREPDDSIVFDEKLKIKFRYDPDTDETIYSAKVKQGMLLLIR